MHVISCVTAEWNSDVWIAGDRKKQQQEIKIILQRAELHGSNVNNKQNNGNLTLKINSGRSRS